MTRHPLSVVVMGGGVAGLAAGLALGRDGHAVTVIERDDLDIAGPLDAPGWDRKGIPHFLLPHAFMPRGRKELRATFPDVFDALVEAGAWDLDLRPKIRGGETRPGDEDLAYLAVRRPVIEWALRRAVIAEPRIRVLGSTRVTGLVTASASHPGDALAVRGVETSAGTIDADLVVDALGRRTPVPAWVEAAGGGSIDERSNDCSIIYYCRYYRVRDGRMLPDGPSVPSPRGDLGYAAFTSFPGDNGTLAALVAIPPGDQPLKALRDARAFDAAVASMPAIDAWTNPDIAEPITDVLPMGSLRNTIRAWPDERHSPGGLVGIGDTTCHTDPSSALGLSFALIHARHLAAAVRDHDTDVREIAMAFEAATRPEMEERFGYVSAIDDVRTRLWAGEKIDIAHADGGAYPFFTFALSGIASLADGDVFRALVRRNTFLDPLATLDDDPAMLRRLEAFYADLAALNRPRQGPGRDELVGILDHATASSAAKAGH